MKIEALPKMAQASTTKDLKEAFRAHLSETKNQVRRLEEIFSIKVEDEELIPENLDSVNRLAHFLAKKTA